KPRPVDCEAGYRELITFLNSEFGCDFNAASVLPRGEYGYVEFVETDTNADLDVRRVGQLSALLYAINARDMHFTNILPTAYGPVPVDLETLLHPHRQKSVGTVEPDDSGYKRLATSVFGTGVLPVIVTHQDRDGYIDVGYLGGGEVRGSGPFRRFRIEDPFSAQIRVSWAPDEAPTMEPDAALDSASEAVRRSCAQMVAGFSDMYRLITAHRKEFVDAVERIFGRAEIRYIHNATVQYVQCLRMLTGSAVSANSDLAQGLVKRIGIASRGGDTRLVDSECRQLWQTDVPYFLIRADRREVTVGSSDRQVVGPMDRSPLEQFRAKMDGLSESDLVAQVRLIRIAFNAKLPDPHAMTPASEVLRSGVDGVSSDDECRDLAARVGDELISDLVQDRYAHLPQTWIGPVATAVANRPWPPGVLGYDLYTGRMGPALTLAGLARVLDEPRFAEASLRVFGPTAKILDEGSYEARSIAHAGNGAYSGFPGALWALACAGRLLDEPDLVRTAQRALSFLKPSAAGADDAWFDTVSGDMGAPLVGLALDDRSAIDTAVQACERALDSGLVRRVEYSGLGHGLAGILQFASRTHEAAADPASAKLAEDVVAELASSFRSSTGGLRT
ncbi:MAG: type 2 lantipeptide synthetase LanM, partial [Actinomycetia bacterium]|nr:type 2 lantipeptide synthetase LanM [Actinomycetes bacterium]